MTKRLTAAGVLGAGIAARATCTMRRASGRLRREDLAPLARVQCAVGDRAIRTTDIEFAERGDGRPRRPLLARPGDGPRW